MTLKLALRNVHRSARDYAVYFLTLALGVAMFYAFNSISEQTVLFDALSAESKRVLGLLNLFMGLFSGAVAFVLAFLVVYANRFLLKRRKHEFGMYLTLGMGAGQVSRILLAETAIVGIASLAVGLAAGIGISQGMSFATAALMGTTMSKYQFILSTKALLLTLVCFAGIFLVSAVVDVVYISRRKLADLISQHESSESVRVHNPLVNLLAFVVSIGILATAYWQLGENGLVQVDEHFIAATVLMIVGTVLFFWSVAGFALELFLRSKQMRFRGLSSFTARQLSSKLNTAFASMSVVCVMLFFAGTTLAGGLGMVEVFAGNVNEVTRYDATLITRLGYNTKSLNSEDDYAKLAKEYESDYPVSAERFESYGGDASAYLAQNLDCWDELVKDSAQIDYYPTLTTYKELFKGIDASALIDNPDTLRSIESTVIGVISVEQFNKCLSLIGEKPVELATDEFALNNNLDLTEPLAQALRSKGSELSVEGTRLHCSSAKLAYPLRTSAMTDSTLEVIVPQAVVESLRERGAMPQEYLNVMYKTDRATGDQMFEDALAKAFPAAEGVSSEYGLPVYDTTDWPVMGMYTGQEMADQSSGLRMVITYLAVYIGFILMLTTAAVLAIQQLSETTDSLPRYRRLATLGADRRMVLRSLKVQTGIYFILPLCVAACHSACALSVLSAGLFGELGIDMGGSIALAAAIIAGIYGAYLLVAYLTSRTMVKAVIR
ncbi:MAG: ABC transporter permease [Coriobacteriales bacterium]